MFEKYTCKILAPGSKDRKVISVWISVLCRDTIDIWFAETHDTVKVWSAAMCFPKRYTFMGISCKTVDYAVLKQNVCQHTNLIPPPPPRQHYYSGIGCSIFGELRYVLNWLEFKQDGANRKKSMFSVAALMQNVDWLLTSCWLKY